MSKLTNALSPIPYSMPVLLVILGVMYTTLMMGGLVGAETALNDSQDHSETRTEISGMDDDVVAEIRADYSGVRGFVVVTFAKPLLSAATVAATWGFDIGYGNPGLKSHLWIVSQLGPGIVMVGVAWQTTRILNAVFGR